ncbi:MAG: right-handed parallel beta-helix repeat-containing protein [Chloroflexus sp.]|nr:right-handed parallel beta-helix repeat-containing protein [Chloroflexus sp.]
MRHAYWSRLLLSLILGVGLSLVGLPSMNAGEITTRARTTTQQAELRVCSSGCVYTNVQAAVDAANPGDVIKVAGGVYEGVLTRAGLRQMVYITKTLTLLGGYTPTNWSVADPVANPTVLDARSGGRVMVISGTITVHVEGLRLTGGLADGLGGGYWGIPGENPAGGGVYIRDATVTISNTVIANNVAAISLNQQGQGGGLYAQSANLTLLGNTIRDNRSASGQGHYSVGGGALIIGGTATLERNQILNNAAGHSGYAGAGGGVYLFLTTSATLFDNLISGNTANAESAGVYLNEANAVLTQNRIVNNTILSNDAEGGGVYCRGVCTLSRNVIAENTAGSGGGFYAAYSGSGTRVYLDNNAITDNQASWRGSGLFLNSATAHVRHNTVARNQGGNGAAIVLLASQATFTNTLIVDSPIGVLKLTGSGNIAMVRTLWSNVITPTLNEGGGSLTNVNPLTGPAGLAEDGYHLTRYSAALGQGVVTDLAADIDGEARPQPSATFPDIGADEAAYVPGEEFIAEKVAFAPQWVTDAANPAGRLQQRYLLRYYYGSPQANPPPLTVAITDTLPAGLAFAAESHHPAMSFSQAGQQLVWRTEAPVSKGQSGEIVLETTYVNPDPGRVVTNTAELQAGPFHFDLRAVTQAPVIRPLIAFPGNGELCPGSVQVRGQAQPGVTVTLSVNNNPIAQVATGANGLFNISYNYPGGDVTLTARACTADGQCSEPSEPVELTSSRSFWDPQRSIWRKDNVVYRFRNSSGRYATENWSLPGFYYFSNTTLELYVCNCPGSNQPPTEVWVLADGEQYTPPFYEPPVARFYIGSAHNVELKAQCGVGSGSPVYTSTGVVLIDPDGFVFDVTRGFDPANPTLHSLAGVTVTCMVHMPDWGGWVPWPAHLYENQINPQVTGNDGYFAFFTPPGSYYLQVEGKDGFQPWRSPVIQVVNEIVHVNVPLTPWTGRNAQVELTPDGPVPATVTVAPGQSVEWRVTANPLLSPDELAQLYDNPVVRLLSARNPLSDTLGFDGGRLTPGQVYRRQFTTPGTYTYSDGLGHTGTVVVTGGERKAYIPLILRQSR